MAGLGVFKFEKRKDGCNANSAVNLKNSEAEWNLGIPAAASLTTFCVTRCGTEEQYKPILASKNRTSKRSVHDLL